MLSVTQLNTYIKSLFDGDPNLSTVFVAGEISNFTNHYRSGHLYFSLKDDRCAVKAVMFSQQARRLRFSPEDGMRVLVRGRVSVYEASGQYQLYVDDMQPDGIGALNLAFEQLRKKLSEEGLFDPDRKQAIPRFPETIAVITSPTGAVIHDIQQVLQRRYPMARLILCPVAVQGIDAVPQLVRALEEVNRLQCADVIIIGRGGGSLEDLWAFNEEAVVRAVAASQIPVISAVGHETDFTLCDFAADLRAPTPSAAAELAAPNQEDLKEMVVSLQDRLHRLLTRQIENNRICLDLSVSRQGFRKPEQKIADGKEQVRILYGNLLRTFEKKQVQSQAALSVLSEKLNTLSPLAVLARGYAIIQKEKGGRISSVQEIHNGERVQILLQDGDFWSVVEEKRDKREERDDV